MQYDPKRIRFSSRCMVALTLPFLVSACGGNAAWIMARETVVQQFSPPPELGMSRQEISDTPYATLKAQFGKNRPALLVLQVQEARGDQWMASNNTSLILKDGRLTGTVGFDKDIRGWTIEGGDPLADNPHQLGETIAYQGVMEWRSLQPEFMMLQCELTPRGPARITILELEFDVIRLREKCDGDGWDFENEYWVDAYDGFVWQSRQHIEESIQPLNISILKPPAQ